MSKYFPLLKHKDIELVTQNIYELRGTMKLFGLFQYSRNMHIIKVNNELALINPIRVDSKTLTKIAELGQIKHIYKIGELHGVDIPFYMDRFEPKLWALRNDKSIKDLRVSEYLDEFDKLPFCSSRVSIIASSKIAEAILIYPGGEGSLISCDAFVNMKEDPMANWLTRNLTKLLPKPCLVGPNWIKFAKPEKQELISILDNNFCNLLTAHGDCILGDAKEKLTRYVNALKI